MIIEKVFSNVEEPSETLYSVLMTEEELRMFAANPLKAAIKSAKVKDVGVFLPADTATALKKKIASARVVNAGIFPKPGPAIPSDMIRNAPARNVGIFR